MAFGQAAGPPAGGRQMRDLEALIEAAGHSDFRDARGPLGLTQRQANGKFTRDEAEALIGSTPRVSGLLTPGRRRWSPLSGWSNGPSKLTRRQPNRHRTT